ncbi:glycosyltransferase [Draconibacterium halophilum]|uniref:Glycosyltransferase n=1 Tax=Draconibacterium halophilum TaxID=2706887 RepID=A0A6C0R8I5_9BACT|nr:glycosyltransferase [Draconibacterium halophilum]QIA06724.1 glycosyltransferase [Draconibacterium halophilum]
MSKRTVVCFGPGPAFKGGMANYNTSLAKTFDKIENVNTHIVSWTQQYPSIVPREFKDTQSKVDLLDGTDIKCTYLTNYNRPSTWKKTADFIASLNPEVVIFQWSIALQGLPLRHIAKRIKKKCNTEIIFDLHFVVQKEKSKIDRFFTKYGIKNSDSYIVHALKTFNELKELFPNKKLSLTEKGDRTVESGEQTVIKLYHPIYDLFQPDPDFDIEKFKKDNNLKENVFLFFGFIRKYKGLHNAIDAFARVAQERDDVSLLICGESFWNTLDSKKLSTKIKKALFGVAKKIFLGNSEDEKDYQPLELIEKHGIQDKVAVFNQFIANEDVHKFFQVSDCVVLYYLTATPSGIESLSYNFKLPILATNVGHFPETVIDGFNGYLADANDIGSMAEKMIHYLDNPLPGENVAKTAEKLSWENYVNAILNR